nr:polysaccharide pyruvyl transferase family protein [Bittarella massiliensis (ex Durand et al. 2017)]
MLGILTWYKTYNYGSALQAYALVSKINSLGYHAEIIQYFPNENRLPFLRLSQFKRVIKRFLPALVRRLFWSQYKIKAKRFDAFFEESIPQSSKQYTSVEELRKSCEKYTAYLCGSDQIWTPTIQFLDPVYFLSFVPSSIGKISYAPSIGSTYIPTEKKSQMRMLISRIDYLSIREEHGATLVESLCGRRPEVVLDPTLLKDKIEWERFAIQPKFSEPYILCYFLGDRRPLREFALRLKKRTGYKLVVIPTRNKDLFFGDVREIQAGPREFVGLIQNAAYICTDSFHGTIFSINLGKNFFALQRHEIDDPENQNARLINILSRLDLSSRFITDEKSDADLKPIDYTSSKVKLAQERKRSLDYLVNALARYKEVE